MRRSRLGACLLAGAAGAALLVPRWPVQAEPTRVDRSYSVTNLSDGATHTLRGFEVSPACAADTVVILLHGLSYTSEAWDVPGYSYARMLGDAGYAVVAVDRLGYGRSPLADGRNVSGLAHADMAAQLARQLGETYEHVVLAGHSAGGEAVVSAVGLFGAPVDAVIPMGYHTFPDPQFLALDWIPGDQARALLDDYEYFLGSPEHRAEMFYTAAADPAVVAADTAAAVLTPSGEIQTLSLQPARIGSFLVDVPVFAQLAEHDRLFPSAFASLWAAQFVASPSVTVDIVPGTGHTYMLHHAGPAAAGRIADWLAGSAGLPGCTPLEAGEPAPAAASPAGAGADRPTPAPTPSSPEVAGAGLAAPVERTLPLTGGSTGALSGLLLGAAALLLVTLRRTGPRAS